jgi:uncharacterized protein YggE
MKEDHMDRNIRVTGKGKISVKPDTIRLDIEAEGVYPDYETAVEMSARETGIVKNTIGKAGLDPKDLKTVRFGIDSYYEGYRDKNDDYKRRFIGYKYTHNMNIKFPNDNAQLGKALYQLSKCAVEVEFSINHTVNDVEAAKNQLLGKAVMDSKKKSEILSEAAGITLGDIVAIDYSWGEIEIYSRPIHKMDFAVEMAPAASGSYDIDIEADDIDVEDTVTIVWEIK